MGAAREAAAAAAAAAGGRNAEVEMERFGKESKVEVEVRDGISISCSLRMGVLRKGAGMACISLLYGVTLGHVDGRWLACWMREDVE